MTGFIKGLFNGSKKGQADSSQSEAPKPKPEPVAKAAKPKPAPKAPKPQPEPQEGGAFFLDADDAKTFGNIDYMRTSKTVKRTFAKKKGVTEEFASVRQVSALESAAFREDGTRINADVVDNSFPSTAASDAEAVNRRQTDSSLDMFRNMAKTIKK